MNFCVWFDRSFSFTYLFDKNFSEITELRWFELLSHRTPSQYIIFITIIYLHVCQIKSKVLFITEDVHFLWLEERKTGISNKIWKLSHVVNRSTLPWSPQSLSLCTKLVLLLPDQHYYREETSISDTTWTLNLDPSDRSPRQTWEMNNDYPLSGTKVSTK